MNRRAFIGAAIATTLAPAITPASEPPSLRAVHRWCNGKWVRCRMFDLRKHDVFTLEGVGQFIAAADPKKEPDGGWGITASYELDAENK
jgi:hypothetical protein